MGDEQAPLLATAARVVQPVKLTARPELWVCLCPGFPFPDCCRQEGGGGGQEGAQGQANGAAGEAGLGLHACLRTALKGELADRQLLDLTMGSWGDTYALTSPDII